MELWLKHAISVVSHVAATDQDRTTTEGRSSSSRSRREAGPAVQYAYQFDVVEVDQKVRRVVEAHMRAHLRSEDAGSGDMSDLTDDGSGTRKLYMPSWHMERLLNSLVDALNGGDDEGDKDPSFDSLQRRNRRPAFTLFILNPERVWALVLPHDERNRAVYGYRCGLSASSMKVSCCVARNHSMNAVICLESLRV